MRTTINLSDALGEAAKAKAAADGRTLTSLIEEGLRLVIEDDGREHPDEPLPVYGDPEGEPLVDLTDRELLWAALDADGRR